MPANSRWDLIRRLRVKHQAIEARKGGRSENTAPHFVKVPTSDKWSISHFSNIIGGENPIYLLYWKMCDIVIQYGRFGR